MDKMGASDTFQDHFKATLFWNSMSEAEKEHIIKAFHLKLAKEWCNSPKVVDMFNNVDQLAVEVCWV
jgi:catalase